MPRLFVVARGIDGNRRDKTSICYGDHTHPVSAQVGGWGGLITLEVTVKNGVDFAKIYIGPFGDTSPKNRRLLYEGPLNYAINFDCEKEE